MCGFDRPVDAARRTARVAPSWDPQWMRLSQQEQHMSARKLSRFAGLVFVLAAVLGGVGAATVEHGTGGATATAAAESILGGDINWG